MAADEASRAVRVLLIGPTSIPYGEIATEVEADLSRLARPGVELSYRCTGAGPRSIRSDDDAAAAAPHVLAAVVTAAADGFDAVIVDCVHDPGVADARGAVDIVVIGPGEAIRDATAEAPDPVVVLTGDDLRALDATEIRPRVAGAATVVISATGWSHVADGLRTGGRVVIDPLPAALDACLLALGQRSNHWR
jgi:Asp/Glu/hydantoin racemase